MSGHHIISLKYLFGTAIALVILTILTVAVAYIHIPYPFNLFVAIGIAVLKATLVAAFFMGLVWDKKINTIITNRKINTEMSAKTNSKNNRIIR